ncbi:hypothetical protein CHH80_04280 [Bacillus sp. 7504-2]|nr:hypothetical protein CHH80_04280 [Bacillus sp. 7504-2]
MTTFFSTLLLFYFLYLVIFKFIDRYLRLQLLVSALSVLKMYDPELKLLKQASEDVKYINYRADILYCVGMRYAKLKQFDRASEFFFTAFTTNRFAFFFKKEYRLVLQSFVEANKMEEGKKIFHLFLEKAQKEKKYKKITEPFEKYFSS